MIQKGLNPLLAGRTHRQSKPPIPEAQKIRFLIAHENQTIRKFIRGCLQDMGYLNVVDWIPGTAILGTLLDEKAHVLIVNGESPDIQGWEMVRTLRSLAATCKAKVIIVGGDSSKESIQDAIQAGVDDYIILPFSLSLFEKRITALFAKKSGKDEKSPVSSR